MADQLDTRNWILTINTAHPAYLKSAIGEEDWEADYNMQAALPWILYVDMEENELGERQFVNFEMDTHAFMNLIDCMGLLEKESWQ